MGLTTTKGAVAQQYSVTDIGDPRASCQASQINDHSVIVGGCVYDNGVSYATEFGTGGGQAASVGLGLGQIRSMKLMTSLDHLILFTV